MRPMLSVICALAMAACTVSTEESVEIEESPEVEPLSGGGHSCPYTGSCPAPDPGKVFMYWLEATDVDCKYRLVNYPYTVSTITVSDGGCETDCCPIGSSPPCNSVLNYTLSFTCY